MQITEIKVFPVKEEKLKAFVSIVLDRCFMVNDIKVIKGRDGLFISMPSRRKKNGKFKDVAHPLNNETRQMIEGLILAEYESAVNGTAPEERPAVELGTPEARSPVPAVVSAVAPPPVGSVRPEPAPEPAVAQTPAAAAQPEPEDDKSLEEVTELHLRDDFWNS